jgi:LPPG:FO 2-phospho-L-lactate transferase
LITALAGGVGAAKFLTGLATLVKQEDLSVIVNTGDDIELFGLHISPDIDIVAYTLAGIVDESKGWGIKDDSFHCLEMLKKYGLETWFSLGDRDLATHIHRSDLLRKGFTLSQITNEFAQALGLKVKFFPMTDDKFETRIRTSKGLVHFEEYLVRNQAKDEVLSTEFVGANAAKPAVGVVEAIMNSKLIIVCPSNPIVSIGTILAVNGIRDALQRTNAKVVAVSPIVAGATIKGPADKLFRGLGLEVSAFGVAKLYADFADVFVIDVLDVEQKSRIEELGFKVKVTDTVMKSFVDKVRLAKIVLDD